jgi:hypothetical protein
MSMGIEMRPNGPGNAKTNRKCTCCTWGGYLGRNASFRRRCLARGRGCTCARSTQDGGHDSQSQSQQEATQSAHWAHAPLRCGCSSEPEMLTSAEPRLNSREPLSSNESEACCTGAALLGTGAAARPTANAGALPARDRVLAAAPGPLTIGAAAVRVGRVGPRGASSSSVHSSRC